MKELNKKLEKKLAKRIIKAMKIGKKPNTKGIKKAEKKYEWVNKILEKDTINREKLQEITELKKEELEDAIQELSKPNYGPLLFKTKKGYKVKKKIGETVIINMHPNYESLAETIADRIRKIGCHAKTSYKKAEHLIRLYKHATQESLTEVAEPFMTYATQTDAYIGCTLDSSKWREKVSTKKLKARAPVTMLKRKLTKKYGQRWVLIGLPFKKVAKEYKVPYKKFKKVILESLEESFKPRLKKIVNYYSKKLSHKKAEITADDGTKLTLKCRRMLKDMGEINPRDKIDRGLNLPTGEAFTAPVETSVNGKIFFEKISPHGHGIIKNVWLTFKNGKMTEYEIKSKKDENKFKKFLNEHTGDKNIVAELGIGCNKKAQFLNGFIIVDEKIYGTIHIAIGDNLGYGGKNNSSLHFDMIKDMTNCNGQIKVGDKLIMDQGEPVGLNLS